MKWKPTSHGGKSTKLPLPPCLDPRKTGSIHLVRYPPLALCLGKEGISVGPFADGSLHCPVSTTVSHRTLPIGNRACDQPSAQPGGSRCRESAKIRSLEERGYKISSLCFKNYLKFSAFVDNTDIFGK